MNPLKLLNVINKLSEQINKLLESREDLKQKFENEGIRGKLVIEDTEVLFLIRKKHEV